MEKFKDEKQYYRELTSRNSHFINEKIQNSLKNLKILIAGCGSTGGACTQSLARLGVSQFWLADNGEYELSNLNRQHAYLQDINKNKAQSHAEKIKLINPYALVNLTADGITKNNANELVAWSDIVVDAVDVTTYDGMQAKIELHKAAYSMKKPVLSALDLGFRQWGMSFDYRFESKILKGKLEKMQNEKNPIKALFTIYPISSIPTHCLPMIIELLEGRAKFASQLGSTSDMLSSLIVPVIIRFCTDGHLVKGWNVDQSYMAYEPRMRWSLKLKDMVWRKKLRSLVRSL